MPLAADSLSFTYPGGREVLSGVTLQLTPGKVTALLGPNGAGKSTLLRLFLGLLSPTAGTVTLDGRPLGSVPRPDLVKRVGYVPQRASVAFPFTALEVVRLGRYAAGRSQGDAPSLRALEAMDMAGRAADLFGHLSAGQQQRVTFARTLAQLDLPGAATARVLLADEPVSAMDPPHALHTMRLCRDLAGSGHTVLVVLHDVNLALSFADEAVLMAGDGRLHAAGPAPQVLSPHQLSQVFGVEFTLVTGGGRRALLPA